MHSDTCLLIQVLHRQVDLCEFEASLVYKVKFQDNQNCYTEKLSWKQNQIGKWLFQVNFQLFSLPTLLCPKAPNLDLCLLESGNHESQWLIVLGSVYSDLQL